MENNTKSVAELNVGDHIIIIDEAVRVFNIRHNYLNGRTFVAFEYVEHMIESGINTSCMSWLLFKPEEIVTRAFG